MNIDMSEKSSDSESASWAVVSKEDAENSDDGSSSSGSSDFVKLENTDCVSYHHNQGAESDSEESSETEDSGAQASASPQPALKLVLQLRDPVVSDEEDANEQAEDDTVTLEDGSRDSGGSGDTYTLLSHSSSSLDELPPCQSQEQEESEVQAPGSDTIDASEMSQPAGHRSDLPGFASARLDRNDSDSDHSDFVRLEPSMAEEAHGDLMKLSGISSASTASSLSSSFRFIHRSGMVLGAEEYMKRRFYRDNDDESVQSDIDDRCESDISGVADDDMSSYSLGDLPISAGNVVRSYTHRPNNNLNSILTTLALVVLFGAVGIGIGHFLGTRSEARLRRQQVEKMKSLTDEYLVCLQQQELLEERLDNDKEEHRLAALADEWKEQYEELVAERVQLEEQIATLEESLHAEHERRAALRVRMQSEGKEMAHLLEDLELSHKAELSNTQKQAELAIAELKNDVNVLRTENDDLKSSVAKMRYNSLPAAQSVQYEIRAAGLRTQVNELAHENSDLKRVVGRLRYTQHPGNPDTRVSSDTGLVVQPDPSLVEYAPASPETPESRSGQDRDSGDAAPVESDVKPEEREAANAGLTEEKLGELKQKLAETTEKLSEARGKADMWRSLFQAEAERAAKAEGNAPDVMTCLFTMFPDVTLADLTQISQNTVGNVTDFLSKQLHFIQNMTRDQKFSDMLKRKWSHFQDLFDSPTVKGASEKAQAVYNDLRSTVENKFHEFKQYSGYGKQPESSQETPGKERESGNAESHFDKAINKTKETVQKLTEKINETWYKVKDIPVQLAETVVPAVTRKVEKFTDKVNSGWNKVNNKVNSGWQKVKKKVNDGWFKMDNRRQERREDGRGQRGTRHQWREADVDARRQYHGDPYWNADDAFDDTFTQPIAKDRFENKPDHKQKQSKSDGEKRYDEFWGAVGFDPDDIFHDGFFEGNDRKWRKHQKTLHKLHGRIQKLNEDILCDMDDDDIEDLYDDLEDFEEDLDLVAQPMTLKTWLSCQIRWWKSRFQRKHRDEDLIQGCGRQLMHWQMKSSCSVKVKGKKDCGTAGVRASPACQHFISGSVIKTVAKPPSSKNNQKNNKDSFSSEDKNGRPEPRPIRETGKQYDPEKLIPSDNKVNFTAFWSDSHREDWIWGKQDKDKKSLANAAPEWLFERSRDLDYRLHRTDWIFRRAQDRDFHRKRPWDWYHGRVGARENKHHELRGKQ